jgi:hypothetical protein
MFKNLCLAVLILFGVSLGCVAAVKKCEIPIPEPVIQSIDRARAYVHGWNMMAYAEGCNQSFYDRTNSAGERVFVAVNVDVDFTNSGEVELYKILLNRISNEWFIVSGSRLVQIISSERVLTMWTDKDGAFHSILQRGKNV